MVEVKVLFSTNYCEKTDLKIDEGAIQTFTTEAYADGTYRVVVQFECMPRAFNPDIMQIIIDLTNIGECVVTWLTICKAIVSFAKAVHGYKKHIMVIGKEKRGEIIKINDETTPDELEREIKDKLDN